MKRKASGLIFVCMAMATVLGVAGCGGKDNHELRLVEGKDSSCYETGYEAYYVCDDCGLLYADEAGKQQIEEPVIIPLKSHTLTEVAEHEATCTENGIIHHWECTVCDKKFSDAEGRNETTDVVDYAVGHDVVYFQGQMPTTESDGTIEHYECNKCGELFLDKAGSKPITEDKLTIPKVQENLDGALTESFYSSDSTLYLGGSDLSEGGVGLIVNARTGERGVYLHMQLNHNYSHTTPDGSPTSFIRLYLAANNNETNSYTGRGVGEVGRDIKIEFGLDGTIDGDSLYFVKYQKTVENSSNSKTPYTSLWEVFIPFENLASANNNALAEAFEDNNGICSIKKGYNMFFTVVGSMFVNTQEQVEVFTPTDASGCDDKDGWYFWFVKGYGDWSNDQKMWVLNENGLVQYIPNAYDVLDIQTIENEHIANWQVDKTVDYDGTISGSVTADSGYVVSGIKINGKIFTLNSSLVEGEIAFGPIATSDLGLRWFDSVIEIEAIVTERAFQDIEININVHKDGTTTALPQGASVVLTDVGGNEYTGIVSDDNGKVIFSNVLISDCTISSEECFGKFPITLTKGITAYGPVTLEYKYATSTGTDGYGKLDLSNMNEANHALTLDGLGGATGTNVYVEAKLNLPETVANSKYVIVETTLKFNGTVGLWSHRFGIKITENKGIGVTMLPADAAEPRLQVFEMYAENANALDGWSDTYKQYYSAVATALNGEGLQIRIVRSDTQIIQYAYIDGAWVQFGPAVTCDTNAKTDIRFLICDGSWTFSNIKYDTLEYIEAKEPQLGVSGNYAHLRAEDGKLYTLNGQETTEEAITIAALTAFELEVTVNGRKDGTTNALADGTVVILVPEIGEPVQATITGGKITATLQSYGTYTVTSGDYEGTVIIAKDALPEELTLGYKYATSTGTDDYGKLDLSNMNEANHALTLDGLGGATGTNVYVEAKLNLPETVANSKYVIVETTLKFNGTVGLWSHRFGIKITENKGIGVTMLPADAAEPRLQVFEMYAENANALDGWSDTYKQYYSAVATALNGEGLQIRIVRSDTQIIQYAYIDGAWVQFGPAVTCDTNAKTDIRFLICDGSWTFSNIVISDNTTME